MKIRSLPAQKILERGEGTLQGLSIEDREKAWWNTLLVSVQGQDFCGESAK